MTELGRFKAVLFDMDGVLVNSEHLIMTCSCESLRHWGLDPDPEDFLPFVGSGEDRLIGGVSESFGVPYDTKMKEMALKLYIERAKTAGIGIPGARETVSSVKAAGLRAAVCSAADLVKVNENIRCLGLEPSDFDVVLSADDAKRKKPAPDIYLTGAGLLGLDPGECVVVEDAVNGIIAGHAAGCPVIGVTTSFSREELMEKAGPEWVVDEITEILEILDIKDI
ncbi:MAG: HAD-IA family hydrolase [Clostridia bacterium]|nr:HAD-IA family hydrolase [Clostridia bacterium]